MRAIVNAAGAIYTNYTAAVQTVRARTAELLRCLDSDSELAAHIYKADI